MSRQFRADVDDDTFQRLKIAGAENGCETNAKIIEYLLREAGYGPE